MRRLLLELRALLGSRSGSLLGLAAMWVVIPGLALMTAARSGCCAPGAGSLITPLLMLCTYLTALLVGGAVPVMLADLHGLCAPGRLRVHAGAAVGVLLVLTVLAPALMLVLAAHSAEPALAIANAALTGLVLTRLPRALGTAVVLLALAVIVSGRALQLPSWLYLALMVVLAAWLWPPVLVGDSRALEVAAARAVFWSGRRATTEPLSRWSSWWFPVLASGSAPAAPTRMVRTCLGPLYTPASRAALRLTGQGAVPLAFITAQFIWTLGWHKGWRVGVLMGLLLVWLLFGLQVAKVLQRPSGELAELALLPGMGDRRRQLGSLLSAAVGMPLALAAAVSALALLAGRWELLSAAAGLHLLEWLGTTTVLGMAFMTSALTRRLASWIDWVVIVSLVAVLAAWALGNVVLPAYPAAWAVLPLLGCLILALNVRRLGSLPHPYVLGT